ncbi:MAG: cadmium-translocating P-type ATPase [Dehalococcoidia bacterium]|nr:cadmium-translocating P-type ATPase [Dehalococcoidia bacterium]
MWKSLFLQGLSCANCAIAIEESVRKLDGVSQVSLNYATTTLRFMVAEKNADGILEKVIRCVHEHEPHVRVIEKGQQRLDEKSLTNRFRIGRFIVGAVLFVTGMVVERIVPVNHYIAVAVFAVTYLLLGSEIIFRALRSIMRAQVFNEYFLMTVATVGAFAIGEYAEAVGVMLFYLVGEYLQELAVRKSKRSIAKLMDIRPDTATLCNDGVLQAVASETVKVGDTILVKPGERIPLDGEVLQGHSTLDMTALTGESLPRKVLESEIVLSGSINLSGVLTLRVIRAFGESTASKIIEMVENAGSKKAPTESFITRFARFYTPAVVGLALIIAVLPPLLLAGAWQDWLRRGLIFLVISCPCALVISIPLGFFAGIGNASQKGILVKGGNYLDALGRLDTVIFDKTGTLTKGVFDVIAVKPSRGHTDTDLMEMLAKAEVYSNHPIALSILRKHGKVVDKTLLSGYAEISGCGVTVNDNGKVILAGNEQLMRTHGIACEQYDTVGTKVYVAVDGVFVGSVVIADEIRPDSLQTIAALKRLGVKKVAMLTGDNQQIAEAVAKMLEIDEVHSGLLPHEKVDLVEKLSTSQDSKGKLAFVGDGINDAPVLAMAEVGIAMGGLGADAAIEAADVVLMNDEPSKLIDAIKVARYTKRIVWQNIVLALGVKAFFLIFGAMGLANMWEAVFADVGVTVLAVFNSMRVMKK